MEKCLRLISRCPKMRVVVCIGGTGTQPVLHNELPIRSAASPIWQGDADLQSEHAELAASPGAPGGSWLTLCSIA